MKYDYSEFWKPKTYSEAVNQITELPLNEHIEEARYFAKLIKEYCPSKYSTVVDFGCGIGRIMLYLDYHNLIGIDTSQEMLDIAKDSFSELPFATNFKFIKASGEHLPIETNSVDLIYSFITLQHIDKEDVSLIVKEFYHILKVGGRILLHFPMYGNNGPKNSVRSWSPNQVETLLKLNNFALIEEKIFYKNAFGHLGDPKGEIIILGEKK